MNFDLISMAALATSAVVLSLTISAVFARTQWQRIGIAAGLASWFALVIALGATGYIGAAANRPGGLGLAVVLPLAILSVLAFGSKTARQRVAEAGLFPLISVQILRVLGILFVLSYARNELPAPFAPVAGWGDVTVGLAAIPLSLLLYSSEYRPRALLVAWNILGIADLVTALTLGALSSPGPIRMFWGGAKQRGHDLAAVDPHSLLSRSVLLVSTLRNALKDFTSPGIAPTLSDKRVGSLRPLLNRRRCAPNEIFGRPTVEQSPGNQNPKHCVSEQLWQRIKSAHHHMENDPCNGEPAGPVPPTQKKYPADDCHQFDGFHLDRIDVNVVPAHELYEVPDEADYSDRDIEPRHDRHRDRTPVIIHGSISSTASLGSNSSAFGGSLAPASSNVRTVPT